MGEPLTRAFDDVDWTGLSQRQYLNQHIERELKLHRKSPVPVLQGVRSSVQSDSAGTIFLVDTEDNGGQVGVKEDDASLYISCQESVRSRVQSVSAGTIFLVDKEDNGKQVGVKENDASLYFSCQGSVRSRVQSDSAGTIFLVYAEDNGGQVGMKDDGSLYISRQGTKFAKNHIRFDTTDTDVVEVFSLQAVELSKNYFLAVNPQTAKVTGMTKEEMVDQSYSNWRVQRFSKIGVDPNGVHFALQCLGTHLDGYYFVIQNLKSPRPMFRIAEKAIAAHYGRFTFEP